MSSDHTASDRTAPDRTAAGGTASGNAAPGRPRGLQQSPDRSWWTAENSTPLRTRVMAGTVATCLLAVCALIWMSPGGVLDQVQERVTGVAAPDATELELRAQLAEAQEELAAMQEQVAAAGPAPAVATGGAAAGGTAGGPVRPGPTAPTSAASAPSSSASSSSGGSSSARPSSPTPVTSLTGETPAASARPTVPAPEPAHCEDFTWQQDAQVALVADLQDPGGLDNNRDGIACGQLASDPTRPASAPSTVVALPTAPSKESLVAPQAGTQYVGLYTQQAPFNWSEYNAVSTGLGVTPSVVGYFGGWDQQFRPDVVIDSWQRGTLPMLTWESRPINSPLDTVDEPEYSLSTIIDGTHDAYLTAYAEGVAALGLPIAIRLDHEMNSAWYPWSETGTNGTSSVNGNSRGEYVAAWRHVHDVFEAAGANDEVIWVWAPNITNNLTAAQQGMDRYWPGEEYVDWVGLSGYYRPPFRADNDATFGYTFDRSLAELRSITDKPVFLAEVGASATLNGDKVGWVSSFFAGVTANPDVIGFAWFNNVVTTRINIQQPDGKFVLTTVTNDWRLNSRADSSAAASAGLAALVVRRPV